MEEWRDSDPVQCIHDTADIVTALKGVYQASMQCLCHAKEKNNPLNSIAEAVGEDTIIAAKEGEGVFTKEQTEALIRFAEKMGGGMDENGNLVISFTSPLTVTRLS